MTETAIKPQFCANHRFARISPRKVNLVLAMIRGKNVNEALHILRFSPKRASYLTAKVLKSAIANAESITTTPGSTLDVDVDRLVVRTARADGGPMLKRFHPVCMGRAFPIRRRTCHIQLVLEEGEAAGRRAAKKAGAARAEKSGKSGNKAAKAAK